LRPFLVQNGRLLPGFGIKSQVVLGAMRGMGVLRLDGRRGLAIASDYVGAFFDVYLKGQAGAQLQVLARKYPEVRVQ
jgi:hypothetical protein